MEDPKPHELNATALRLLVALVAVASVTPALAQSAAFQPLQTMSQQVLEFMTGPFATTAATIACAVFGYLCLISRIPWGFGLSVIAGIAAIFGSAQIISGLTSGMGN